ncbi:hypothetical protein GUITHDRAFT_109264 [Guillardia theta CCMP2712]|uniref:Coenzyme Q-binding protein COQ10 START domain-containing protein n=1 Tax=Guillardia theta (strain CCMP2712) TaxID=905079 RepID=L1J9S9_GUITC|nr:hypothetical protein GUITHDRAFT_109264 [Guillardia theta CCMP2712]EKX44840.1 hypothetical protein GUITHDRAFT_109264 [Guillardia theta CCMP2712]|eukprot:XP_005831820.1 hypothetical protein GUITHDRAFT_109264 [Guillardia theta CCMP2712]
MSEAPHRPRRFIGSRRLHQIKNDIAHNPSKWKDHKKLLGSRRLGYAYHTWRGAVNLSMPIEIIAAPTQQHQYNHHDVKIKKKESATSSFDEPQGATDSVEKSIEIEAGIEQCYRVACGFEDYPKWAGSVQHVKVLEEEAPGLGRRVEYAIGAFGQRLEYTLEYAHEAPERVQWRAVDGSVKLLVGSYRFEALGEGRTRVTYKLAIDPGFPVPGLLKQASTKLIVSTALNELKRYTELPSTRAALEAAQPAWREAAKTEEEPVKTEAKSAEAKLHRQDTATLEAAATDSVEKSIEIEAGIEQCYRVACGFEDYPKWAGSVQHVKVLEEEAPGLGRRVEYAIGAFGQRLEYTLEYAHEAPERVRWRAVDGSVKLLVGSYRFEALGEGRTRVTYKLAIDPGFPVPGLLKQASTKLIVSTALNELKRYTELPSTRAALEAAQPAWREAAKTEEEPVKTEAKSAEAKLHRQDTTTLEAAATDSVEKSIEIEAGIEQCYRVACGFEDYPKWAGSVQHVKVLEEEAPGLGRRVEYAIGAFGQRLEYTLEYAHEAPERVRWRAVDGSVKLLVGSYRFEALGEGRTRVTYKLAIDPGFPVPGLLKQASTKLIVSTALNELKKYVERSQVST